MNNSLEEEYASLDSFSEWYRSLHGYASLVVCLLGIALNFFNIIVLTRKHMLSSTNAILTALAISDFITMLVYIPTSLKFYCILEYSKNATVDCNEADTSRFDFFWTNYALFYINVTVTMHSFSIWLTVLLAFFRYAYICHNKLGKKLCTRRNTNIAIAITFFLCLLLCFPGYIVSKIEEVNLNDTKIGEASQNGKKLYQITSSDINRRTNDLIFRITFTIQSFCVKLIPCFLLIILSSLLVRAIHVANENNKRLMALGRKTKESERSKEHNRTNIMLVLVCFLFFITEFPQGVLAFLSIVLESRNFHSNVYMKLGDIMDILALINNAVNFILYCLMSHIFRETFRDIFCKPICLKYKKLNTAINMHRKSENRDNIQCSKNDVLMKTLIKTGNNNDNCMEKLEEHQNLIINKNHAF